MGKKRMRVDSDGVPILTQHQIAEGIQASRRQVQYMKYLVAGAKFEPENTRLMDTQRVKSAL